MNTALKQRLIGAIVLVAMAVIFLPMLLDGSGARERFDVAMEVPEKPEAPRSRFEDTPTPTGDGADRELARAGDAGEVGMPEAAVPTDDATAGDETADAAAAEAPDGSDTDTAGADDSGSSGPGAWVVQVGSFTRETNALVLRDQLREAGYEAFVEEGEGDGETWWRVRVGPVPEREQAEELRVALEQEREGSSALVMAYP